MTVAIAGATGLVGSHLLPHLLTQFDHVVSLGRRKVDVQHRGLDQRIVDFEDIDCPDIKPEAVFCALGTTRKKAGKEGFVKVDRDFVVNLARWGRDRGATRFLLVSSVGANAKSRNLYLRTKGQAEEAIAAMAYPHFAAFRPGVLMGKRQESRPAEWVGIQFQRLANPAFVGPTRRYRGMDVEALAQAMVVVCQQQRQGVEVLTYDQIVAASK